MGLPQDTARSGSATSSVSSSYPTTSARSPGTVSPVSSQSPARDGRSRGSPSPGFPRHQVWGMSEPSYPEDRVPLGTLGGSRDWYGSGSIPDTSPLLETREEADDDLADAVNEDFDVRGTGGTDPGSRGWGYGTADALYQAGSPARGQTGRPDSVPDVQQRFGGPWGSAVPRGHGPAAFSRSPTGEFLRSCYRDR